VRVGGVGGGCPALGRGWGDDAARLHEPEAPLQRTEPVDDRHCPLRGGALMQRGIRRARRRVKPGRTVWRDVGAPGAADVWRGCAGSGRRMAWVRRERQTYGTVIAAIRFLNHGPPPHRCC